MTCEDTTLVSWRCGAETWLLSVLLLNGLILHLVPIQVPLHTDQAALSLHPFTLCSEQPFCTWSFAPFVARFNFLHNFKVFGFVWFGVFFLPKATSEALNMTLI